jgi:DNA (cytosine-5)-methyltransferase 1
MARIKALDVFCGVGALSYGLRKAGVSVVGGVDVEAECRFPYEHNVEADFWGRDVRDLKPREVRRALAGGDARLIVGCAPCQPFSEVNRYRVRDATAGGELLSSFQNMVISVRPEFVAFENVEPVVRQASFARLISGLRKAGYAVWYDVVDAHDYGAAQRRRRLVMLASRLHDDVDGLRKTPGPRSTTVQDAIGHLPRINAGEYSLCDPLHRAPRLSEINLRRIQASKPGGTWSDWPASLRLACHTREAGRGYTEPYGRMHWERPSPTITTKFYNYGSGRFGHPEQDRTITPREAALLQGFPLGFSFHPPEDKPALSRLGRLIGNAVPVPLAFSIGRTFRQIMEEV